MNNSVGDDLWVSATTDTESERLSPILAAARIEAYASAWPTLAGAVDASDYATRLDVVSSALDEAVSRVVPTGSPEWRVARDAMASEMTASWRAMPHRVATTGDGDDDADDTSGAGGASTLDPTSDSMPGGGASDDDSAQPAPSITPAASTLKAVRATVSSRLADYSAPDYGFDSDALGGVSSDGSTEWPGAYDDGYVDGYAAGQSGTYRPGFALPSSGNARYDLGARNGLADAQAGKPSIIQFASRRTAVIPQYQYDWTLGADDARFGRRRNPNGGTTYDQGYDSVVSRGKFGTWPDYLGIAQQTASLRTAVPGGPYYVVEIDLNDGGIFPIPGGDGIASLDAAVAMAKDQLASMSPALNGDGYTVEVQDDDGNPVWGLRRTSSRRTADTLYPAVLGSAREDGYQPDEGSSADDIREYYGDPDGGDYDPDEVAETERQVGERHRTAARPLNSQEACTLSPGDLIVAPDGQRTVVSAVEVGPIGSGPMNLVTAAGVYEIDATDQIETLATADTRTYVAGYMDGSLGRSTASRHPQYVGGHADGSKGLLGDLSALSRQIKADVPKLSRRRQAEASRVTSGALVEMSDGTKVKVSSVEDGTLTGVDPATGKEVTGQVSSVARVIDGHPHVSPAPTSPPKTAAAPDPDASGGVSPAGVRSAYNAGWGAAMRSEEAPQSETGMGAASYLDADSQAAYQQGWKDALSAAQGQVLGRVAQGYPYYIGDPMPYPHQYYGGPPMHYYTSGNTAPIDPRLAGA